MYPISLCLTGKPCIVFGAGNVAKRRVKGLLEAGAIVTVVAPEPPTDDWTQWNATYLEQSYAPELLQHAFLVFAATDNVKENERIVRDAKAVGKLVSSVTHGAEITSDFIVPAHRTCGNVTVSVTTNGTTPALAGAICREFEPQLVQYSEICACLGTLRRNWQETIPDFSKRMQFLRKLTEPNALALFRTNGKAAYLAYAEAIAEETLSQKKTAILLVSHGISDKNIGEQTIGAVECAMQNAFPTADVYRAFTDWHAICKLRKDGVAIDTVQEALEKIEQRGYTNVYCQPTFVIPGKKYEQFCADAAVYSDRFPIFRIGNPLLANTSDYSALVRALETDGVIRKSAEVGYVLMGHGTAHIQNGGYAAFDAWLRCSDYKNIFVGTIDGHPTSEALLRQLKRQKYQKLVLIPLFLTVGKHVRIDIAGNSVDSRKTVLEQHGYSVSVQLKGLGAYPSVQALYAAHVRECLDNAAQS